jgi:hypothetical protein
MPSELLKFGYYREDDGTVVLGQLRAVDVIAEDGSSAEDHISNETVHLSSDQIAAIAGAAQKNKLTAVVTDQTLSADGTGVNISLAIYNADTDQTSNITRSFPLASSAAPGAMTKEAYAALQDATADIMALKAQGGRFIGRSFPNRGALSDFTITDNMNVSDFTFVANDEDYANAITQYYIIELDGVKAWAYAHTVENTAIGFANEHSAGLVKGSVADPTNYSGYIFIELDGAMVVIGWDELVDAVANLEESVVKVTGNQSISGVKTFTSEIVLPSKVTAPANDGTKPATEAQLFKMNKEINDAVLVDAGYVESESDIPAGKFRDGAIIFMPID